MSSDRLQVVVDVSKLEEIKEKLGPRTQMILQKLAQETEADIKNSFSLISPSRPGEPPAVDTGTLKNSIVATPFRKGWRVSSDVEYAPFLEFGTGGGERIAARPFFLPAVERAIKHLPRNIEAVLGNGEKPK